MPQQWGLDSVPFMDQSYGGTTLANYAINDYFASPPPRDTIIWWARYFTIYSGYGSPFRGNGEVTALINAVYAYTGHRSCWILPISDDEESTVSGGDNAQGTTQGNAVCQKIQYWVSNGGDHAPNLHMPGGVETYVYLDIETNISSTYWAGWSSAIWNYYFNSSLNYPFYPAAYCGPSGYNACSVINTLPSGGHPAYSVWSWQPRSDPCYSPGPSWAPYECSSNSPECDAWQYGANCMSGYVDTDLAHTSWSGPYGNGLMDLILYCD